MYIRDCHIENVGPIQSLDLQFPLREDGTPKPVVFLGENGTGKSTLLSMVADALLLLQQQVFADIVPRQLVIGSGKSLRFAGGINQRGTAAYGLSALRFEGNGFSEFWVEKTGKLKAEDAKSRLGDRFGACFAWSDDVGTFKYVPKSHSMDDLKRDFIGNSYCYFPSEREERPIWLNDESVEGTSLFRLDLPLREILRKPLVITGSVQASIPWVMDVMLDASIDLGFVESDKLGEVYRSNGSPIGMPSRRLLGVLNKFLRSLLGNNSASLGISPRQDPWYRLCVVQEEDDLPSLSCLSSGQAALLGIFLTILRYSDITKSLGVGADLENITGIVLIDEADAHLHTRLQYEVLPFLIKSFPKVQFLITSHSPVLLLGMENQLGRDGFVATEMPLSIPRSSDDYPEAAATVHCFTETKEFRDLLEAKLKENAPVPKVFVEGGTDVRYIETAFHVLGHGDTLTCVKVDTFATTGPSGDINGGFTSLDNLADLYKTKRVFVEPVLLLYDCDVRRSEAEHKGLTVQSLLQKPDSAIKNGIENLLPSTSVPHDKYYSLRSSTNNLGEVVSKEHLEKEKLSRDLCNAADPVLFKVFLPIIEAIESWLESLRDTQSSIVPAGTDSAPQAPVTSADATLT